MKKFVFKEEWYNAISELPDDVRLELYDCIMVYAYRGEVKGLKSKARIAFSFIKQSMDEDIQFKKELSKKRAEAGKVGLKNRWEKNSNCQKVIANDSKNSKCYEEIANASKSSNCYDVGGQKFKGESYSKNSNCYKEECVVFSPDESIEVPIEGPTELIFEENVDSKSSNCYKDDDAKKQPKSDSKNSNCYKSKEELKEEKRTKKEENTLIKTSNNRDTSIVTLTSDITEKEEINKEEKEEKLKRRQEQFYNSLVPFLEKYDKSLLRSFYDYWSEPNKSRTKMRFELEKTWELSRRLRTWSSKDYGNARVVTKEKQVQSKSQFQENNEQLERVKRMLNGE